MNKVCSKCNIEKQIDDFGTLKRSADGKQAWCKPCMKEALHQRYLRISSLKSVERPTSKVCLDCKRELPISQFGVRRSSLDHLQQYCKPCWRVRSYESQRKMKLNAR